MQIKFTALAVLLLATVLSGCGGGGAGEGGSSSVPPQPILPDCIIYALDCSIYNSYISQGLSHEQASERTRTLSIRMINADAAYDRGWTGDGVTVGFYEYAIDSSHPELNGKVVDNPYDEIEPGSYSNVVQTLEQAIQHAQGVAGVASAKRNEIGMHGVAYDSKIEFVSFQNETFNKEIQDQYAAWLFSEEVEERDARAINYLNSRVPIAFSASPGFDDWSDYTPEETEYDSRSWLSALRQTSTSAANRTVWVYSAGNYADPYPIGAGYFPVHFPELRGHVIAAVALDSNGVIADYSNHCGAASTFCIAAPGRHYAPSGTNGYVTVQGTSLAAPTVGGSLAILKQAFPSLGNDELVTRLFATANKTGIYEVASIYGQGLVDLDAATRPAGQGQILIGNSVTGNSAPMNLSTVRTAVPTGNAFSQGFAGRRVMILDELNTPFYVPFEEFVSTDNTPSTTLKKTRDLMNRLVHGTTQTHVNASPWLSIVGQPLAYRDEARKIESWFSAGNRDSFGFASRQSPQNIGKATISFTAGAMIEPQSLLGSTSHGAFGTMSAGTFLTGIEAERPCGTWSCQAAGSLGVSLMRPSGGLIQSSTPTFASSFSLQALKVTPEYNLYVGLSQPIRVESGSVEVAYPSARTPDRKILTESFKAALSPDGRQIDFQAGVVLPLSKHSNLGAQAWISHNPGHIRHSPPIVGAAIAYRSNF